MKKNVGFLFMINMELDEIENLEIQNVPKIAYHENDAKSDESGRETQM